MALLSAKPIIAWCDVNMYAVGNQWTVNSGDPQMLYFQILDVSQAIASVNSSAAGNLFGGYGFNNGAFGSPFTGVTSVGSTAGTRYLLGVDTAQNPYGVQVTFPSIDSNQVITVNATQANPADSSIWVVSIPANQAIGGGNVQFAVTQGNNINRFNVSNMIAVIFPGSVGGC